MLNATDTAGQPGLDSGASSQVPDLDFGAPPASTGGDPYKELLALDPGENGENADAGGAGQQDNVAPAPEPKPAPAAPAQNQFRPDPARANSRAPKLQQITDPAVRDLLAQMSNPAVNKFYELALRVQNGELLEKSVHEQTLADREKDWNSKITNTRFLDHEDGYKLTPEYAELDNAAQGIAAESSFWDDQLANIRQGRPVRMLVTDAQGNIKVSDFEIDPKADPSIEGRVLSKIAKASGITQNLQERMRGLPERHKGEFTKMNAHITGINKSLFGSLLANPNFVKASEGEIAGVPLALRGRPEMQLLGNALAAGKLLLAQNEKLTTQIAQLKKVRGANVGASPDPSEITQPGAGADDGDAAADLKLLDRLASN
jgi:hypothetical protein